MGALIGGVLKGKKGIGQGAAVGATVGIIGGALERRKQREYERYDREVYVYEDRYDGVPTEVVVDIQAELRRLGYRPGPVDGVFGRRTALAIGDYQREHGLLITQKPSYALLKHMYRN